MLITAKHRIKLSKPHHFLATGFGSGMFSDMPGTIGSMTAIPVWLPLSFLSWKFYLLVIIFSFFLGVYFCHKTSRDIKIHDHGCIVWDEFIGMWITLTTFRINDWQWIIIGFLLFRLLDIWKPWPIYLLHRKIHGGIGIIIDDVVAGIIASSLLYCIKSY